MLIPLKSKVAQSYILFALIHYLLCNCTDFRKIVPKYNAPADTYEFWQHVEYEFWQYAEYSSGSMSSMSFGSMPSMVLAVCRVRVLAARRVGGLAVCRVWSWQIVEYEFLAARRV